jgi:hypothetical protein
MRVNRRFLYFGLFLVAIGGVLVAADLGTDTATLTDAVRLWPLALIAAGLGLVLRGTRVGLAGGMVAAALPGIVFGAALAIPARFAGDCGAHGTPATAATQQGTFAGPARVAMTTACGTFTVKTAAGSGWLLTAANTVGRTPTVSSTPTSLSVSGARGEWWRMLDAGRDAWDLTLPTAELDSVSLTVNAGHGEIALAGAHIARLTVVGNASRVHVDAADAAVADLSAVVRVGELAIDLPAATDLSAAFHVDAGDIKLCAPPSMGLHVTATGSAGRLTVGGAHEDVRDWRSDNYTSAAHHADVRVGVSLGSVEVNPIGGCK